MLINLEMWGYFLSCGVLCIFYVLAIRRIDMSGLARNAISASVSVLYLCGHFADHMQSLTDHLYLLGMALFMVFLGYQAWKTGSSEVATVKLATTKPEDLEIRNVVQ